MRNRVADMPRKQQTRVAPNRKNVAQPKKRSAPGRAQPKKRVAPARAQPKKRAAPAGPGNGTGRPEGLYKADGSRIKSPSAYVANFEKQGQTQTLFNARGQVVNNPAAYVARMMENEGNGPSKPRRAAGKVSYYGQPGRLAQGMFAQRQKTALTKRMRARPTQSRPARRGPVR